MYSGRQHVRSFARPATFTKCAIMYREETARPRRANFCIRLQVDKLRSPAIFSKSSTALTFIFKIKNSNRMNWKEHDVLEPSGL